METKESVSTHAESRTWTYRCSNSNTKITIELRSVSSHDFSLLSTSSSEHKFESYRAIGFFISYPEQYKAPLAKLTRCNDTFVWMPFRCSQATKTTFLVACAHPLSPPHMIVHAPHKPGSKREEKYTSWQVSFGVGGGEHFEPCSAMLNPYSRKPIKVPQRLVRLFGLNLGNQSC
jgi:hypothetical protein